MEISCEISGCIRKFSSRDKLLAHQKRRHPEEYAILSKFEPEEKDEDDVADDQ